MQFYIYIKKIYLAHFIIQLWLSYHQIARPVYS